MRFTAYEEALRTPSRRLKNEKPNQHPGDSQVILGLLIAGLYLWASNQAYHDCINLGVC